MSSYIPTKQHLREVLLHYFIQKKKGAKAYRILVETYGDHASQETTCKEWYRRFNKGDYDVEDKKRQGAPQKFTDTELESILEVDSTQTLKEIAQHLGVDRSTVGKRLIQKEGVWVLYKLKDRDIESVWL